jgi:predicted DCC family thiol-disulfide oxidoreductase YuxK
LIEGSRYLIKSNVAIRVLQQLPGWWSLLSILTIIPEPIRDWCYDLIARNRYKWFGEANHCALSLNIDHD